MFLVFKPSSDPQKLFFLTKQSDIKQMSESSTNEDQPDTRPTSGSDESKDDIQLRVLNTPPIKPEAITVSQSSLNENYPGRSNVGFAQTWDLGDHHSATDNEVVNEQVKTEQVPQLPVDNQSSSQPVSLDYLECSPADPGSESRWLRRVENGQEMYIDKKTDETWIPAVDSNGKTYYYEVNSRHSVWFLDDLDTTTQLNSPEVQSCDFRSPVGTENCGLDSDSDDWSDFDDSVTDTIPSQNQPSVSDTLKSKDLTRLSKSIKLSDATSNHRLKSPAPKHILLESVPDALDDRSRIKDHISGPQQNRLTNFERRAVVHRCTVFENGKSIPKKWTNGFLLLSGSWLLLYKDARGAASRSSQPYGKPEIQLNVQEIQFSDADPKYTSRPNVLQIEFGPSEKSNIYLVQVPGNTFDSWKTAIRYARQLIEEERISTTHRSPNSGDIRGPFNLDSSILAKLRDFFRNRPSAAKLRSLGILQNEPVFASTLVQVCEQENSDVPNFVVRVIRAIEARGLEQLGIYRVSGNGAAIQKLRCAVNQNNYSLTSDKWSLEVLTGALKLFFRELKEPLITFKIYPEIGRLITNKDMDPSQRINEVRDLLNSMPPPHLNTARVLLHHLHRVTLHSETNKMEPFVLGIVFGPSLLWPEIESRNFAAVAAVQAPFVVYMLQHVVQLFGPVEPPPVVS